MLRGSHTFTRAINFGSNQVNQVRAGLQSSFVRINFSKLAKLEFLVNHFQGNLMKLILYIHLQKTRCASWNNIKWEIIDFNICRWQCLTFKLVIDSPSMSELLTDWKTMGHGKTGYVINHKCFGTLVSWDIFFILILCNRFQTRIMIENNSNS